jgi:hypothetical protein
MKTKRWLGLLVVAGLLIAALPIVEVGSAMGPGGGDDRTPTTRFPGDVFAGCNVVAGKQVIGVTGVSTLGNVGAGADVRAGGDVKADGDVEAARDVHAGRNVDADVDVNAFHDVTAGGEVRAPSARFGDLTVFGTISAMRIVAAEKDFRIDHPLDPKAKYLVHASVESSERKNIYDGTAILDERGEAVVELPDWFEALNTDFRYQLTCVGQFAPVYVAEKIQHNRFKIGGGPAGLEVCWMVTGNRQDHYAQTNPLQVEIPKAQR